MSEIPSAELRHKIAAARLWAAQRFPYLASVLFASPVVYRSGHNTISADRHWRLYVDAERAAGWPVAALGSLLVLQANHLLREHAERADTLGLGPADADTWSDAADAEINDDLAGMLSLPEGDKLVMPDDLGQPRGRLAEEYFAAVRGQAEQPDQDVEDDQAGDGDQARDGEGGQPQRDGSESNAEGSGSRGRPDRGSATHGQHRPGEHGGPEPDRAEDRAAQPAISPASADLIRRQVAGEIAAEHRRAGTVPAGLLRWAEARLGSKVDWRRALAAEIRRCVADVRGQVDYSYRRPSRRAGSSPNVILPALRRPQPEVVVVCDTSASMGEDRLAQVLAEVEGLLRSVGVGGLAVLSVDAALHTGRRVTQASQVELVGGGGTDMRVGIDAALARRPRPDVIVVLTDGETPWPLGAPRGVRVVVGLIGTDAPAAPSWARSVPIDLTA